MNIEQKKADLYYDLVDKYAQLKVEVKVLQKSNNNLKVELDSYKLKDQDIDYVKVRNKALDYAKILIYKKRDKIEVTDRFYMQFQDIFNSILEDLKAAKLNNNEI